MTTETITWIPIGEKLPDDDSTVLLFHPDASEPVWPGYRDGRRWKTAEGMIVVPTHWAAMPGGPSA